MKVVRKDHSNLMVLFIDQLFHLMMQPCTELNTHRKKLTHVQLHFLSKFHLFFGMIFFHIFSNSSSPRSGFVHHHTEETGHKFYQPAHEVFQNQFQQQQQQPQPITA